MDYGHLFKKKGQTIEAMQRFQEAYLIFESYFGIETIQTAEAAMQLSILTEEDKQLEQAFEYA